MPKYLVRVYETIANEVVVVAESEAQARELGYDEVLNETNGLAVHTESLGTDGSNIYVEEVR